MAAAVGGTAVMGGSRSSGGTSAGGTASEGGARMTGGASSQGGAAITGGASSQGGAAITGGASSQGGAAMTTGGASSQGGAAMTTGGASTGGNQALGGASGGSMPGKPSCLPAPGGSNGPVQAPVLRITLPASWDENWLASPAIADVDGDRNLDIVAARHSVLYVWRNDGTLLWKTAVGYSASTSPEHGDVRIWASPVVGDLDGDGQTEIAVGSNPTGSGNFNLHVYDRRGELRTGWPQRHGDSEVRSIAGADVDADGIIEILSAKTGTGPATAVFELDGSMHPGFPQVTDACNPPAPAEACWDYGGYNQNIGAGDLDGDGALDVVSTYDAIGFGVFHGDGTSFPTAPAFVNDRVITSAEAYHDPALALQGWGTGDRSEFTDSPPVVADVNQDGNLEIVLAGDHEHTTSTDNRGVTLWVLNRDLTRPPGWEWPKDTGMPLAYGDRGNNIVDTTPSPSVADFDPSPGLEMVFPAYDGSLHAFAANGAKLWAYPFAIAATPFTGASEALILDLDRDGVPELLFTTFTSGTAAAPDAATHLIILDAQGGLLHRIALDRRGSMAASSVADLDGDGELELVISLKDTLGGGVGGVEIWDLPGSAPNCVLWGTGRGGLLRQGYVPSR